MQGVKDLYSRSSVNAPYTAIPRAPTVVRMRLAYDVVVEAYFFSLQVVFEWYKNAGVRAYTQHNRSLSLYRPL